MKNILTPVTFKVAGNAQQFCQRYRCGCRSPLVYKVAGERYQIECPNCGPVAKTTVIRLDQHEQATHNERAGRMELAQPSGKTPAEILAELGF